MIVFENNNDLEPYKKLRDLYDLALSKNQMNIEAILIASFSHEDNEVDSRFVNFESASGASQSTSVGPVCF